MLFRRLLRLLLWVACRREIIQNFIQNLSKSLLFNFVFNFVQFLPREGHSLLSIWVAYRREIFQIIQIIQIIF